MIKKIRSTMDNPDVEEGLMEGGTSLIDSEIQEFDENPIIITNIENPFNKEIDIDKLKTLHNTYIIDDNNIELESFKCRNNDIKFYYFKLNKEKTELLEIYKDITHLLDFNEIEDKVLDDYILDYVNQDLKDWIEYNIFQTERDLLNDEDRYTFSASYKISDGLLSKEPILDSFYIMSIRDFVVKSLPQNCNSSGVHSWLNNDYSIGYQLRIDKDFNPLFHSFIFQIEKKNLLTTMNSLKIENYLSDELINNIDSYINNNNSIFDMKYLQFEFRLNCDTSKIDRLSIVSLNEEFLE